MSAGARFPKKPKKKQLILPRKQLSEFLEEGYTFASSLDAKYVIVWAP